MFFWNSCFFDDPVNVGNLISGSSAFSKTSLNVREFTVHVLLKPGLENFEHYFASISDIITNLEPDILECEVKWALESITMNKASGGDGIPIELFQILKDGAVKVLYSICQQIWKTQQWPQDRKRSVFITIPKKGNAKECSNYRTIALIRNIAIHEQKTG